MDCDREAYQTPAYRRELARDQAFAVQRQREAAVRAVLNPVPLFRPWLQRQVDFLIRFVVEHGVTVYADWRRPRAVVESQSIFVDRIGTEPALAAAWHELGHVLDRHADAAQHRHELTKDSRVSPIAECFAWRFAAERSLTWTHMMQETAEEALGSYRRSATADERREMDRTLAWMQRRVTLAPDEDRAARMLQIQRQDRQRERARKVAQIEGTR